MAPPNRNCPSTTLNHVTVEAPRLLAPMPTVHHHVADEAQMEPIGDVLPKWLGVILSVRIDRLSRLSARTAVKGARNRARPPLSIKPGLRPGPLLAAETVVALQSFVPFPIGLYCTIIGRQCYVRIKYNENNSQARAYSTWFSVRCPFVNLSSLSFNAEFDGRLFLPRLRQYSAFRVLPLPGMDPGRGAAWRERFSAPFTEDCLLSVASRSPPHDAVAALRGVRGPRYPSARVRAVGPSEPSHEVSAGGAYPVLLRGPATPNDSLHPRRRGNISSLE